MRLIGLLILLAWPAYGQTFDHYVLALSWSPTWCEENDAPQCDQKQHFVVHGLWPQNDQGWPEWCDRQGPDPSRADSRAMGDIMDPDLAWYQWRKHGRCSGLSGLAYYETMREAFEGLTIPPVLDAIREDVTLPASVVEDAFIDANPRMTPEGITVTCDAGRIDEVRICLTKDLQPRPCGSDAPRDCRGSALMPAP
ncbi:ribonuclease T2 [Falsirhodobacter sp. alg1]|uniref:ribonuclease T2 family protein n=1 Tax=Falsirhodobacter sp. alg1 TaxID=1472418 RepID=UPI0005EDFBE5|nr:ribonuclease T2 [Falsirhodobacter sp. alg1]